MIHTSKTLKRDGSNDIDKEQIVSKLTAMIHHAATKFEKTKVIYSELLPRQDMHGDKINKINHAVRQNCRAWSNVDVIQHENIKGNHLFVDPKHLNRHGVALFATNLKGVIFRTLPRKRKLNRRQSESHGHAPHQYSNTGSNDNRPARRPSSYADEARSRQVDQQVELQQINQQLKPRVRLLIMMMLPTLMTQNPDRTD